MLILVKMFLRLQSCGFHTINQKYWNLALFISVVLENEQYTD